MSETEASWPESPQSVEELRCFDGGVSIVCAVQSPDRYSFFRGANRFHHAISRGAGLSYAAASFGKDYVSVEMTNFDRLLAFDQDTGVVEVEAGMRLGKLFEFLARRGHYLPVQPGHGNISVGGCVAADVHGKNQARDGTFIRQIAGVTVFHPVHGRVFLSPTLNAEIFRATCGGFGLTGTIVSVRLQAKPIPSNVVDQRCVAVDSLGEGMRQLRESAETSDFAYSWHDFSRLGRGFGRGYVRSGVFAPEGSASSGEVRSGGNAKLSPAWRARLPVALLNPLSAKLVNSAHRFEIRKRGGHARESLAGALFPVHGSEVYFRLFGSRGFHEYQALVPHARLEEYIAGVKSSSRRRRVVVTLASAKLFSGLSDLLRFSGDGICFSVNVPRGPRSLSFLEDLDGLVIEVGGKPNIIKDSRLPRAVMDAAYPEADRLRALLRAWDPARIFRSELSTRLGL
jgi:decaprenylphospho-beta-D-ribofuranose 2-oxidase